MVGGVFSLSIKHKYFSWLGYRKTLKKKTCFAPSHGAKAQPKSGFWPPWAA
jgi:hypothetical protein